MTNDADYQVALFKTATCGCFFNAAERFMAEDQVLVPFGGEAVFCGNELEIGAADSQLEGANQHGPIGCRGFRNIAEGNGVGCAGSNGNGFHDRFVWVSMYARGANYPISTPLPFRVRLVDGALSDLVTATCKEAERTPIYHTSG